MTRKTEIPPDLEAEMTPAVRRFVDALLERLTQLEDRLKQSPQNSSQPPSTQHPHANPAPKPTPSGRKPGGQPGHTKHQRHRLDCECCGTTTCAELPPGVPLRNCCAGCERLRSERAKWNSI